VDLKQPIQLQRLPLAHELSATKDEKIIDDEDGEGGAECGEVGFALDKFEVLGFVAVDSGKDLFEEGPYCETKGPVNSWHANFKPV